MTRKVGALTWGPAKTRRGAVLRFLESRSPSHGNPGEARAQLTIRRGKLLPLQIVAEATEFDQFGPFVEVWNQSAGSWIGRVAWASLKWTADEGPADLILSWFDPQDGAKPTFATVSDSLLLATDRTAQWAVRAFWERLPHAGPPTGIGLTRREVVDAVLALRTAGADPPTQETVAEHLGKDSRSLRRVGSWESILDEVRRTLSG